MANIGEIIGSENKRLLLNGIDIPKTVLGNHWDELVGSVVRIWQHTEIDRDLDVGIGRLVSISPKGICKFTRKNGSSFKIDLQDIRDMRCFISKNYQGSIK
jgi:hypothetical protein